MLNSSAPIATTGQTKKRNLNKHIEIAHTCKKCSMKCNMQNHSCRMKIKSFKCTICQEKFLEEIAMTNHIQSHCFNGSRDISNQLPNPSISSSVIKVEPQDQNKDQISDQIEDHFVMDQEDIICQPDTIHFTKLEHKVSLQERKTNPTEKKILDQTEKKATCEIEDRVANANGRFPCKYCTQTFSKNIYAISHEKKSCKSRSNKI